MELLFMIMLYKESFLFTKIYLILSKRERSVIGYKQLTTLVKVHFLKLLWQRQKIDTGQRLTRGTQAPCQLLAWMLLYHRDRITLLTSLYHQSIKELILMVSWSFKMMQLLWTFKQMQFLYKQEISGLGHQRLNLSKVKQL